MPIIEIGNSFSKLIDFDQLTIKKVTIALTYTDSSIIREKEALWQALRKAAIKKQFKYVAMLKYKIEQLGPEKVCWLKDNEFPTGLLNVVAKAIGEDPFTVRDLRTVPEATEVYRWNSKPNELRYYQKEAIDAFLKNHRGVIQAAVGSGKTQVAAQIIKELGVKTLFVVPSSALLTQAHDVFELAFGSKHVQMITTADIKKTKKLKPIRVITIQTLASLRKNNIASKLLNDIDFLVFDECHHSASRSFTELLPLLKNIYYRLGLSGTYLRNDAKILDLWGVSGDIIYDYSAGKATKEGFLTPVEFNILKLKGKLASGFQAEYKANYGGIELMQAVEAIITRGSKQEDQILILVDRKAGCGHLINEYLKEQKISCTYVTGDNNKKEIKEAIEDFNDKKIRILIASQVLGEGCDIRSTDVLIMARGGKSEIAFTQAVGRAVRLYPGKEIARVWDFDFTYPKYLRKHTKLRIKTYEKQFEGEIFHVDFL